MGCRGESVLRQCKFLNNVIEQDHRTVKKRTWLAKGYDTFRSAWRTLEGIETVNMIRKGRVKWVAKGDAGHKRDSSRSCSGSLPRKFSLIQNIPLSISAHSNFATKPSVTSIEVPTTSMSSPDSFTTGWPTKWMCLIDPSGRTVPRW